MNDYDKKLGLVSPMAHWIRKGKFAGAVLVAASLWLASSCTHAIPRFGIGGRYAEGKAEVTKSRGGNLDRAILSLEAVVRQDPTYEDSLTLLGRAYYKKGRYGDARQILERALLVKKDDEIAWLALGLAQMRLGEDQKGLETVKGALTLLGRAMTDGYREYPEWDPNRVVRTSLRRSVVQATKGLEEKNDLIRSLEVLLDRIDDEEWRQGRDRVIDQMRGR
ncbi:MAG: tetratricopeptide repeat protein [Deltaproteobacteria bacterium]|nr:tetratricopeptide repeat protein [Deltaproteobacteria bacterium]